MVSTTSTSQYITDVPPTSSTEGKNPLALLAKTCETIGLPDSGEKRRSPEKKDSSPSSGSAVDKKLSDSAEKKRISPRSTPTSKSEPITSTTFPGLPKSSYPMGAFPGMMPFYPTAAGMMPFSMPSFFPMAPFMGRVPCPSALMRTPCVTPGCTSCTPEMAAAFANPLFSAYAAMMPTSSASAMGSYQQLLAAAAAHSVSSNSSTKHTCNWVESTGLCGKQFTSADELGAHMKSAHAPSPPSSATTPEAKSTSTSSRQRFHPYAKTMPAMPMTPFNPMLHAMYAQRMMGMPHP